MAVKAGVGAAVIAVAGLAAGAVTVHASDAGPGRPSDPSGIAMPKGDLPGWTLKAADDFTGSAVHASRWQVYRGTARDDHAGYFDPSHLSVADGELIESTYRDPHDGDRWTSAGMKSTLSQTYGMYEVRLRFTGGAGVAHDILLWPTDNASLPQIDFSNDSGAAAPQTNEAALREPGGRTEPESIPVDLSAWHTFGVIWTPGALRYTVDGAVWAVQRGAAVPSLPMRMAIQTQAVTCTKGAAGPTVPACTGPDTPPRVDLDVDWAVQYAYTPGRT
jgi:beta-glucanase (GH16 family)